MSPAPGGLDNKRFISFILVSFIVMIAYTKWLGSYRTTINIPDNKEVTETAEKKTEISKPKDSPRPRIRQELNSGNKKYEAQLEDENLTIKYRNYSSLFESVGVKKYQSSGKAVNLIAQTEDIRKKFGNFRGPFGDDLDLVYLHKYQDKKVILEAEKDGWYLKKSFFLTENPYVVDFSWQIEGPNASGEDLYVDWSISLGSGAPSSTGPTGGQALSLVYLEISEKNPTSQAIHSKKEKNHHFPDSIWAGIRSQYFLMAFIPNGGRVSGSAQEYALSKEEQLNQDSIFGSLSLKLPSSTGSASIYLGPMEYNLMASEAFSKFELKGAVPFGYNIFRPFAIGMLKVLQFFFDLTRSYGLSIILLTLCVKLLLWYPTQKSMVSMRQVQLKTKTIQPQVEAIKRKYKGNSSKIGEETMALYRQHGINPVAGCLPMLLQIPVMLSLYATLASAIELRGAPMLWISDLSKADPFYILPVLMGIGMLAQTILAGSTQPTGAGAPPKFMLYMMPVMFTAISFSLPSGLNLYWAFLNTLSILQTYLINKKYAALPK